MVTGNQLLHASDRFPSGQLIDRKVNLNSGSLIRKSEMPCIRLQSRQELKSFCDIEFGRVAARRNTPKLLSTIQVLGPKPGGKNGKQGSPLKIGICGEFIWGTEST